MEAWASSRVVVMCRFVVWLASEGCANSVGHWWSCCRWLGFDPTLRCSLWPHWFPLGAQVNLLTGDGADVPGRPVAGRWFMEASCAPCLHVFVVSGGGGGGTGGNSRSHNIFSTWEERWNYCDSSMLHTVNCPAV